MCIRDRDNVVAADIPKKGKGNSKKGLKPVVVGERKSSRVSSRQISQSYILEIPKLPANTKRRNSKAGSEVAEEAKKNDGLDSIECDNKEKDSKDISHNSFSLSTFSLEPEELITKSDETADKKPATKKQSGKAAKSSTQKTPVSYTHLDVYKRQISNIIKFYLNHTF